MALPLSARDARYDRYRDCVVMNAGQTEVAVTHSALETYVNRRLDPDEAVNVAIEERLVLARVANTLTANDDVITITASYLNSRNWSVAAPDGEEE